MNEAIHWSGLALVFGALVLAVAIVWSSVRPLIGQPLPTASAALLHLA